MAGNGNHRRPSRVLFTDDGKELPEKATIVVWMPLVLNSYLVGLSSKTVSRLKDQKRERESERKRERESTRDREIEREREREREREGRQTD